MKKFKSVVALLCVVTLLVASSKPVFEVSAIGNIEDAETSVTRVEEIAAWRETNSETYLLSDGSYECVVYADDKYYVDESNMLQLIDNSIELDETTAQTANRQYKNRANSFDVVFSDSMMPEITVQHLGETIAFSALSATGGNDKYIVADDTVVRVGAVENCDVLNELTYTGDNTITYPNAFYNSSLVYVLDNNALKEYIVLENEYAPNEFVFLFDVGGLSIQTADNGAAFVDENGTTVFSLDSLFAVDANGVLTENLSYNFVQIKDTDSVIVSVTLDPAYLYADEREFPIVIDPTIMISSATTADACVCSGYPSTNYQTASQLRTGYDVDYGIRRSYIRFEIPDTLPVGGVTSATLDIEKISGVAPTIRAYRCAESWSSGTITWNNQPDNGDRYGWASSLSVPYRTGSTWYTMDVTNIVQAWVNRSYDNYGFVLEDDTENNPNHWTSLYSSDAGSPHKPELHITYTGDVYQYYHYYDGSFGSVQQSKIPSVVSTVNSAFYNQFRISFTSKGSPVRNDSFTSGTHKDIIAISNTLNSLSRESNEIKVLWTDYPDGTYCSHVNSQCAPLYALAVVYRSRPVIHILNLIPNNGSAAQYEACMALLLMHETAHTLGMGEGFGASTHSLSGIQCVMEEMNLESNSNAALTFYNQIKAGADPFCAECETALIAAMS